MSAATTTAPSVAAGAAAGRTARRGRRAPLSIAGLLGAAILALAVLTALLAPFLAPHDPAAADVTARLGAPSWAEGGRPNHFLGTDQLGRDLLSRVIFGARTSLLVVFGAVSLTATVGGLAGLVAGYYGGWPDMLIMRLADVQLAFPSLLLAITIMAVTPPSLAAIVLVLAITGWVAPGRLVRSRALSLRRQEFVQAAVASGAGDGRIILRHLLPNVLPGLIVIVTIQSAQFAIAEASLSFLGLGLPPAIPSWGGIMNQGREYIELAWWIETFPGLAIVLLVSGLGLLGDWARDALDPRMRV